MSAKFFIHRFLNLTLLSVFALFVFAQTSNEQIVSKVSPAVVFILTGEGGGRLQSTGSGFIVKENGVLLTAYHLIKDAREVQVRLKSGEVFDKVELLGYDERRDVAALRIQAKGLPVLPLANAETAQIGEKVFVISNPSALTWSASDGILSAIRLADVVPTAGTGYNVMQFTAPVSAGSSGAPVVDAQGRVLGIVVFSRYGESLNFAIPVNSVAGLADATSGTPFGAGTFLRPPVKAEAPASAAIASVVAEDELRGAKTLRVSSNTEFFASSQLETALMNKPEFKALKLLIIDDYKGADLRIEVDRPLFTFDFTYKITDTRTNVILASGKVGAWDSVAATPELTNQIVKRLQAARVPQQQAKAKK